VSITVRDAGLDDAGAIARIYNQGIDDRVATLETSQRSEDERHGWLAARGPRHPVLVAVVEQADVVGWASLNQFSPRPAYDHVADISVYVAREHRGTGLGTRLLTALDARARAIGYHKLVLAGFPFNTAALHLYERQGFQTVGIYHEQGQLDGRWVDTIIMEKILR
jgi:phosphinothricin acetyltransferase